MCMCVCVYVCVLFSSLYRLMTKRISPTPPTPFQKTHPRQRRGGITLVEQKVTRRAYRYNIIYRLEYNVILFYGWHNDLYSL